MIREKSRYLENQGTDAEVYQNICILPRKIPINIQITYFRTWNSPTILHFQLSAILFDFLQTNLDRFF